MKRLLPFILLVVALALLVALPLLRLDKYRSQLANHLTQQLGRQVVIGRLEAGFIPPAIRLRDLAIMSPSGDAPLLQADLVNVPLLWPMLFKGAIVPHEIHIQNWNALVRRKANGTWAWDEWWSPSARLGQKTGWPVTIITFDRGEYRAVDPFGPGPQDFVVQILQGKWESAKQYVSVNGVFTSLPAPVSFLFQANGHFGSEPEWSGVLGLSDENRQLKFECRMGSHQATANGVSALWRFDTIYAFARYYGRLPIAPAPAAPSTYLQGWNSHYEWQSSSLTFTQTSTVAGGRGEAKGTIVFLPTQAKASIEMGLQSAKFQPVEAALFGTAPLDGVATGLAHFDISVSTSAWESLAGQGALEILDGHYFLPNSSTHALIKAHTMRYMQKKFPGFMTNGVSFSKAAVRWKVQKGQFSLNDAFANLGDVKVALTGVYDAPRHGLDAYVRVQINERNRALLKELPPSYVSLGEGTPRIQPMNGHVQGSLGDWRLRAIRGSKIPPAVQTRLRQAIQKK